MKPNTQRTRRMILPALLVVALLGSPIAPTSQAARMAPGAAAAMAGGTVVAWGDNSSHQVDIPPGLSGVTAIAAGLYHNLALKSDRTVVAWGWNSLHQVDIPPGLSDVTAIAAGLLHSLALKNLSLPQQISQLIIQVQNLVIGGSLSAGQGAGLIAKLNGVIAKYNGGQTGAACNQLGAFINQVNGLIGAGALSPAQGQALITAANNIEANLGC